VAGLGRTVFLSGFRAYAESTGSPCRHGRTQAQQQQQQFAAAALAWRGGGGANQRKRKKFGGAPANPNPRPHGIGSNHAYFALSGRPYFAIAARSRSTGKANTRTSSAPVIVSAASSELRIASSVACAVAKNNGFMRAFGSICTPMIPSSPDALAFA